MMRRQSPKTRFPSREFEIFVPPVKIERDQHRHYSPYCDLLNWLYWMLSRSASSAFLARSSGESSGGAS